MMRCSNYYRLLCEKHAIMEWEEYDKNKINSLLHIHFKTK